MAVTSVAGCGIVAVGALLLVALGGGAFGGGTGPSTPPGNAITWHTDVVDLQAADFGIVAGGKTFTARVPKVAVSSDPGDATYRTLEVTWQEHGVEQRLYLYFGGDATSWWVDKIRIYNGAQQGEWLYATDSSSEARSGPSGGETWTSTCGTPTT